ncbi:MAG: hypothetical protein J6Y98_01100 [Bacteroidales bacterium]|nr:hypothetical protein [Bacteroidales bacterium]
MPKLSSLRQFLKQHPHYLGSFLKEISQVWVWRLRRQPIVVLTTESGGLGDYLWFRSYYSVIREHYAWSQCRIIVVGMRQWVPLATGMDSFPHVNHFDLYRSFESPDHPLRIEQLFFKLFKANVYVDFRARHLQKLVRADNYYFGEGFRDAKLYYESANNKVMNRWFTLPAAFKHTPPILPIAEKSRDEVLNKPYVVVVEGGNTQGKLSEEQTMTIVEFLLSKGYIIFFNGDYKKYATILSAKLATHNAQFIDGYTYPLPEYPAVVSKCLFVVTVNTFIYHLAVQLEKPCVVLSANEYESIKLDQPNQIVLFNKELQQAYESNTLHSYQSVQLEGLQSIESERIVVAMEKITGIC